jgi:uncharacterized protein YggU (UPF0235/DUF167 family)
MTRNFDLHNGQRGSALAVRITPRASRDQIVGVLNDGTVKIHLASTTSEEGLNTELISFLSDVLGTPKSRLEIVAGNTGRDKIVSVIDMDVDTVNQRIIAHMD